MAILLNRWISPCFFLFEFSTMTLIMFQSVRLPPAMVDFVAFSPLPPSLDYGFLDFLQIFLLGDFTNLLTIAPKGVSSLGANDSVNTTMLLQVLFTMCILHSSFLQALRRLPTITTIPVVVSLVLLIITSLQLLFTVLAPHRRSKRSREESLQLLLDSLEKAVRELEDRLEGTSTEECEGQPCKKKRKIFQALMQFLVSLEKALWEVGEIWLASGLHWLGRELCL